jgi:hypothetical protein
LTRRARGWRVVVAQGVDIRRQERTVENLIQKMKLFVRAQQERKARNVGNLPGVETRVEVAPLRGACPRNVHFFTSGSLGTNWLWQTVQTRAARAAHARKARARAHRAHKRRLPQPRHCMHRVRVAFFPRQGRARARASVAARVVFSDPGGAAACPEGARAVAAAARARQEARG